MTQQDVVDIVKEHPGILQKNILEKTTLKKQAVYRCIRALEHWGKLKRIRTKWTYALFLVE